MAASVDAVIHRLEQQLRKYKEKVLERHRQPDARRQSSRRTNQFNESIVSGGACPARNNQPASQGHRPFSDAADTIQRI